MIPKWDWKKIPGARSPWAGPAAIIGCTLLGVLLRRAGDAPETPATPVAPVTPTTSLEPELREALEEAFPTEPADRRGQLVIHNELAGALTDLGLRLESSRVLGTYRTGFPHYQRLEMVVHGPAPAQVAYLGELLHAARPIRVVRVDWQPGDGPGARLLTVQLDVFLRSETE